MAATSAPQPDPPASRRPPPPCWTHDETDALIDAYREKWYSLRRSNLKASHWQEVADSVAHRCSFSNPSKTSVQCRHKIEKLRKRYRNERQRAALAGGVHPSWVHFRKMDAMEIGGNGTVAPITAVTVAVPPPVSARPKFQPPSPPSSSENVGNSSSEEDEKAKSRSLHRLMSNGVGVRFRMPKVEQNPNPNSNPNSAKHCSFSKKKKRSDSLSEVVSSIRLLGEGFMRVEQMKMEMGREMERMRMEMEMKRMEMILDSQNRIVESFMREWRGKKRAKRMPSPEN